MPSSQLINNYAAYEYIESNYPHVASKLALSWGAPLFSKYVTNLLLDSRDGGRVGFTLKAGSALAELSEVHDIYFPEYALNFNLD